MKKSNTKRDGTEQVNQFMEQLDHPFKAEVQMILEVIKNANQAITDQIKWKAPSFSYKGEYLVTFNLRDREKIHLVFHNPATAKVKSHLLEGNYKDRRMAYFANATDIKANKTNLEKALQDLIQLQKRSSDEKDRFKK